MVWSLAKISLFILAVAALSMGFAYLLDLQGSVTFEILNYEITTSLVNLIILLLILIPVIWVVYFLFGLVLAVFRFFVGDETALTRYLNRNKDRKGYEALAESMVAMAAGEPSEAAHKIALAERHLGRPELTGLLAAQSAERMGNKDKAQDVYKKLLGDDKTRFVGIVGILKHRLEVGDTKTALQLAKKAFELKPGHEETQIILLRLQTSEADWEGVRNTWKARFDRKRISKQEYVHGTAVTLFAEGKKLLKEGNQEGSLKVFEANKLAPSLVPAAVLAAQLKNGDGDHKNANRILTKAWNLEPHPDLAQAYTELEPDETDQHRHERFKKLIAKTLMHPESRMTMAELAISRGDFGVASHELENIHQDDPTVRTFLIMAAIEKGKGSPDQNVKSLLSNALTAPRGNQWICNTCQQIHKEWQPVCISCQAFDTLTWRREEEETTSLPSSIKLLPLINEEDFESETLIEDNSTDEIINLGYKLG